MQAVAIEAFVGLPESFLDSRMIGVYDFADIERVFDDDETTIKTAVQLFDYEER